MKDMSIKLVRYSVVLILCFCSLWSEARVTVFSATDKKTTTDEFVTVRDGKFFIGQKEYRFVGTSGMVPSWPVRARAATASDSTVNWTTCWP